MLDTTASYSEVSAYFNYFNADSAESMQKALKELHSYVQQEGPYDGVLGYSQGAALAATYLALQTSPPPFKCAVFLSGARPADPTALEQGELRLLDAEKDRVRLHIPTAHIWDTNDKFHPGASDHLSLLCDPAVKQVYLHQEGHNIPDGNARAALLGLLGAIRRTIDKVE